MKEDAVVLIMHGLSRTPKFLEPMEKYLSQHFATVINAGYPSTKYPIEHLTENHLTAILQDERIQKTEKLFIVTHSLSSLMLRFYLQNNTLDNLERVVMVAPPNHGSELAQWLKQFWLYRKIYGPAGVQLGVDDGSFCHQLKPIDFDAGIIIGDQQGWKCIFNRLFSGPNDGCVSIESAKLENMADFKILDCNHGNIVSDNQLLLNLVSFLRESEFKH